MQHYDSIVVGLGAMGSAALYTLATRGQRVLGLEAFAPGHTLGSYHGESRIIRLAYYEHPNYVPLLRRAYTLWADLHVASGRELLRTTGGLMIGRPDSELIQGARASAETHGLAYSVLDPRAVAQRYPALRLAEDEVALWEPTAGVLAPEVCVDAHVSLAHAAGAETRYGEPVRAWQASDAGVQVVTDVAAYGADQVVVTCGARMRDLLPQVPVQAERVTQFWLAPRTPSMFALGRLPVYLWEIPAAGHIYGFPHLDRPGAKVARHHTGDVCDPATVDRTVHPEDERRLRAAIADRLPDLQGPVLASAVCLYENSPDGHFLIDRVAEHPNVVFAGGFSGHGFKFASVVGEIVADMVMGRGPTPAAEFLRLAPERLTTPVPPGPH